MLRVTTAVSARRSEEHTSELQSRGHLVCRLLLEKKKTQAEPLRRRHHTRDARGRGRCPCWLRSCCAARDLSFFFNDPATTEIYTLSLHDALPILPPFLR